MCKHKLQKRNDRQISEPCFSWPFSFLVSRQAPGFSIFLYKIGGWTRISRVQQGLRGVKPKCRASQKQAQLNLALLDLHVDERIVFSFAPLFTAPCLACRCICFSMESTSWY